MFDCIHCKHLVFRPLLLSTDLTFYVDLWRCKGFQPLVSVCSLCLLVFFMKVLPSVLSNSSANDTYIKFADDKSRECAERIIDILIIFVLVSHILQNEACSTLVSTQLALTVSAVTLAWYLYLVQLCSASDCELWWAGLSPTLWHCQAQQGLDFSLGLLSSSSNRDSDSHKWKLLFLCSARRVSITANVTCSFIELNPQSSTARGW